ncbi:MAG: Flp family type IVb pilin [Sphingomonadaceae bacterium]
MRNLINKLMGDKAGASAAEYALIIAIFGVFVVAGVTTVGGAFEGAMDNAAAEMAGA